MIYGYDQQRAISAIGKLYKQFIGRNAKYHMAESEIDRLGHFNDYFRAAYALGMPIYSEQRGEFCRWLKTSIIDRDDIYPDAITSEAQFISLNI